MHNSGYILNNWIKKEYNEQHCLEAEHPVVYGEAGDEEHTLCVGVMELILDGRSEHVAHA